MKTKSNEIMKKRNVTMRSQYAWGGRDQYGNIWLKAWQYRVRMREGALWVMVTNRVKYTESTHPWWTERLRMLEEIKGGTPAKVILMVPKDINVSPHREDHCSPEVWDVKEIAEYEGELWVRIEREVK